jgi:hypothetical protein
MRRSGPYLLAAFLAIVAIAVVAGALRMWRSTMSSADPRGPVASRDEWPAPIRRLLEDIHRADLKDEGFEVFRLGFLFDDSYFVRLRASQELMDLLKVKWGLSRIDNGDRLVEDFWARMPSAWRADAEAVQPEYYASSGWLAGDEGDLYVVMYHDANPRVLVWYYFNF